MIDIIFYGPSMFRLDKTTENPPMSIIRTNSYNTIPECQLTLTDDYKGLIYIGGYVSFTDEEKIYQITSIETTIDTETIYTVTAQEIGALILSRRIANNDYFSSVEKRPVWNFIELLINNGPPEQGIINPPLTSMDGKVSLGNSAVNYESPSDVENIYCRCIWEKGSTLYDYIVKEATEQNKWIDFRSRFERDTYGNHIVISTTLRTPTEKEPMFLPSDEIESVSVIENMPEYTEIDYTETLESLGPNNSKATYAGRIVTDYYNANYPIYGTEQRRQVVNVTQQSEEASGTLSALTIKSVCRLINNSANGLTSLSTDYWSDGRYVAIPAIPDEKTERQYVYMYANSDVEINGVTVRGLTVAIASDVALSAVKNFYSLCKNGGQSEYIRWQIMGDRDTAKQKINGRYYTVLSLFCTDTNAETGWTPVTPANQYFCIADINTQSSETSGSYNATTSLEYLSPLALVAVEQKLIKDMPANKKDISVTFTDSATAELGDKLQIIAGKELFIGTVSAVTKTWEAGEEHTDIEVDDWSEE